MNADDPRSKLVFDALIKEAEFLRAETLKCIDTVRSIAINSTYVAGGAVPILAGLMELKDRTRGITDLAGVLSAVEKNSLIIQCGCLAVALTCLALLRIYVGVFAQIFNFSRYFREYLVPKLNLTAASTDFEILHWENWLKTDRKKRAFLVGDSDLAVEPVLITAFIVVYSTAFVALGRTNAIFPVVSTILGMAILLLTVLTLFKFRTVLKQATSE